MDDGDPDPAGRRDASWAAERGTEAFAHRAVRTPLPDVAAERIFYEHMAAVADARELKADLLADPDVPPVAAYENEFERIAETFEDRLREVGGEDYRSVAAAYARGERDDRTARLVAYYTESLWCLQERNTIADVIYCPLILRYPDSFTVNVRFAVGSVHQGVRFESPEHAETLDDDYRERYYAESSYSQREAAEYIRETAQILREQFPDPDETSFDQRAYGGIAAAAGRDGATFTDVLRAVDPDPARFDVAPDAPAIVPAGPEADRVAETLLSNARVVA
ncbi:MAG: hypothetical protein ABEJ80_01320 [Halarchaeum sp.]